MGQADDLQGHTMSSSLVCFLVRWCDAEATAALHLHAKVKGDTSRSRYGAAPTMRSYGLRSMFFFFLSFFV